MGISPQNRVFEHISSMEAEIANGLARLVEVPSVAGDTVAAATAAACVAEMCSRAGFVAECWDTPGPSVVFAEIPAPPGMPTVLFYGHYDVQPPDPLDAWESPPFEPTVRDGALYGRGAGDNKGQFVAHIFAVEALRATVGCPVGVKLLIEGEEEIGSPHLPALVDAQRARLGCDLAVTADGPYHASGQPLIILGVRGLLFLEASVHGAQRDLHSGSNGGTAPAPARILTRALAELWDAEGQVAVPGFYNHVRPPTPPEAELIAALALAGADAGDGQQPADAAAWRKIMFEPNLNIAGISCGYTGPGIKTIIPHQAGAKIDVRLVADQDPEEIYALLTNFLGERGVATERLAAVPPSRTPAANPFTRPIRDAVAAAWERPPLVQPRLGGTTPDFVFTRRLGVPSLLVPYAPPDMHHHAPNERMELSALYRGVRTSAAICLQLAASSRPLSS